MIKSAVIEICHLTFLFFLLCSECDVLQTDGALCQRISSVPWFTGWQRDHSCRRQNHVACRRLSRNKLSKSVVVVMRFCHGDAEKRTLLGGGDMGPGDFLTSNTFYPGVPTLAIPPSPTPQTFHIECMNMQYSLWIICLFNDIYMYIEINLCILLGLNIVSQGIVFFSQRSSLEVLYGESRFSIFASILQVWTF